MKELQQAYDMTKIAFLNDFGGESTLNFLTKLPSSILRLSQFLLAISLLRNQWETGRKNLS